MGRREIVMDTNNLFKDWVQINNLDSKMEIPLEVFTIHCDTRDFALTWNKEKPELDSNVRTNGEAWRNEGLLEIKHLLTKSNKEKYLINQTEIISWLNDLSEASGGNSKTWRHLSSNIIRHGNGWELKYIRFYRYDNSNFIVCSDHYYPIHYKELINNIDLEILNAF